MEKRQLRRAVVTGPTGAIGTALCERLVGSGCEVYAVCRPGSRRASHLRARDGLRVVYCDQGALQELPKILPGPCDAFFHLAWSHTTGGGRNDMPVQIENIRCAVEAVRAAADLGCGVFVGVGSQAEYGRVEGLLRPDTPTFPENGYGMAKLCAGQMTRVEAHKLGMEHIWARVLSVYGPYDGANVMIPSLIQKLLHGERPALTLGEQRWDYIFSKDAAEALERVAWYGRDGAVYPIGSGEVRPLRAYIEEVRDMIDPSLPLGFGEIPYADGQVMYLGADISALRDDVGFFPRTSFQSGIKETIEWVRELEL